MYKNRTTLMLIISAIVMVLSLVTLVLFFRIIANKNEHTSRVLTTLAGKIERKKNIDSLTQKIDEVEATKAEVDGHFVDGAKIDSFIDYLEKLGVSAGTDVKVESFVISETNKNLLLVTLYSKGTFTNIMRTLMLIENAPYQIHITSTSLSQQLSSTNLDNTTAKKTPPTTSLWQANVSFTILTS